VATNVSPSFQVTLNPRSLKNPAAASGSLNPVRSCQVRAGGPPGVLSAAADSAETYVRVYSTPPWSEKRCRTQSGIAAAIAALSPVKLSPPCT
jgi:hypothetical protein